MTPSGRHEGYVVCIFNRILIQLARSPRPRCALQYIPCGSTVHTWKRGLHFVFHSHKAFKTTLSHRHMTADERTNASAPSFGVSFSLFRDRSEVVVGPWNSTPLLKSHTQLAFHDGSPSKQPMPPRFAHSETFRDAMARMQAQWRVWKGW